MAYQKRDMHEQKKCQQGCKSEFLDYYSNEGSYDMHTWTILRPFASSHAIAVERVHPVPWTLLVFMSCPVMRVNRWPS